MEFFGYTYCGPQNYIRDIMKEDYQEPTSEDDVKDIVKKLSEKCTNNKVIDNNTGKMNGFAYGSFQRFAKMKRKGVMKLVGPLDIYRFPPTTSTEVRLGWWQIDTGLAEENWYQTLPRYPQPVSPNTFILDKARKNNKYATLF